MNRVTFIIKHITRYVVLLVLCMQTLSLKGLSADQPMAKHDSTYNTLAPQVISAPPTTQPEATKYDPSKPTIIAWDLHHVLVITTPSNSLKTFINYDRKWDAVKNPLLLLKTTILVSRWVIAKASERLWDKIWGPSLAANAEIVSVEEFVRAGEYYNNPAYANWVKAIINAQMPMPGMSQLLQDLHNAGYEMHIASNIGTLIFEDLINNKKYSDIKESIFKYIDLEKSHAVTFDPALVNRKDIIKKPDPRFFKQYLDKNGLNVGEANIIFIDNSQKNIDAANQVGMIGVLFKDTDQIRKQLGTLGLHIPQVQSESASPSIPLGQKTIYSK